MKPPAPEVTAQRMKIIPIASGSSGNCFFLDMEGNKILIDLGVSGKVLKSSLACCGYSPADIEAVLITHSHSDHIKGYASCMKQMSARVFMSGTTKNILCADNAAALEYSCRTEILPGLFVTAFRTPHDAIGSVGFLIESGSSRFGYATDLGFFPEEGKELLRGADCIVIESNHDEQMLMQGPYPVYLKRRILSDRGHLSNKACGEAIKFFEENGTRHFMLAHLSRENNTPEKALSSALSCVCSPDTTVVVLPMCGSSFYEY